MAYDEIYNGLRGDELKVLRVQYGSDKDSFDPPPINAPINPDQMRYIELPTDLKGLPYESSTNRGFGIQYDPARSCPSVENDARQRKLTRVLRYSLLMNV